MRKIDKAFWLLFAAMIASMLVFGWATGLIETAIELGWKGL